MSSKLLVFSFLALLIGCGESKSVTDPVQTPQNPQTPPTPTAPRGSYLHASTPTDLSVLNGEEVSPLPSVQLRDLSNDMPIAGVRVTFTFGDGSTYLVLTDENGFARTSAWKVDFTNASNRVIATADGNSITFTARIIRKTTIAMYDLVTINGKSLPIEYSGGGATWSITGGQYLLFDDGTYIFRYERNGTPDRKVPQTYINLNTSIQFFLSPETAPRSQFYAERGYLFSTGTLDGDRMTVVYTDFVNFEDEVYVRR